MGVLLPLAVFTAVLYVIVSVIYDLFFHPLAQQPGPLLCRVSSIPTFYYACRGDRHIWQLRMFETYGDRFRAAPNLLLFRSPAAKNAIFSFGANVQKSPWYLVWRRNIHDVNTLSCTDVAVHARRKKALALAFTDQSVKAMIPYMERHVDRWNELLLGDRTDQEGWSDSRDLAEWVDNLMFDLFGDICFGRQHNTKEPGENPIRKIPHAIVLYLRINNPIARSPLRPLLLWLKPRGLNTLIALATPKVIKEYYSFTESLAKSRIQEERYPDAEKPTTQRKDMFHFLCTAKDPDTGAFAIPTEDLVSDAHLLTTAGTDTTSTTVTSVFFYITRNPQVYAKLVKEILATFQSSEEIGSRPELLAQCAYLHAVITESMRMAPSGVCEAERVVRKGGAYIDGIAVPEGITVGVPSWACTRHAQTFHDAYTFRPERWIVSDDNPQTRVNYLKRNFQPFLRGPSACIGQKMAMLELDIIVARTIWRYDVRKAPGQNVGEGHSGLGWGKSDPNQYQLRDAFVSIREGPIVQFREREHPASLLGQC